MQWKSLSDFFAMDGYGLFIWGAYGLSLLCMLVEPLMVSHRRRTAWQAAHAFHEEPSHDA